MVKSYQSSGCKIDKESYMKALTQGQRSIVRKIHAGGNMGLQRRDVTPAQLRQLWSLCRKDVAFVDTYASPAQTFFLTDLGRAYVKTIGYADDA